MTHVHYHVKQTASGEALSSGEPSPEPCVDREGWEGGGRLGGGRTEGGGRVVGGSWESSGRVVG